MGPKTFGTLDDAKSAKKVHAVVVVADDELRSYLLLRALTDLDVPAVFTKLPYAKDNEDLKRWKVTAPGALVLLDPTAEPPKLIKVLRAPAPAALKKELTDAAKAVAGRP
ncbi:MAG TPA: hypothetical protein VF950_29445 [Planctomycetota bacterium]